MLVRVLERQAERRTHLEEMLRNARDILRLAWDLTPERLEEACEHTLALQNYSYGSVRTLNETPAASHQVPAYRRHGP